MTGVVANAAAMLAAVVAASMGVGGLSGERLRRSRWPVAGLVAFTGALLLWDFSPPGPRRLAIMAGLALVALILGNLTGKLLGLQAALNRLGARLAPALPRPGGPAPSSAWAAFAVVMAMNPLAIPGAVVDGLAGPSLVLVIKACLDVAALMAFGRGLPVIGGVVVVGIVTAWQSCWALAGRVLAPWLMRHHLAEPVLVAAGLLVLAAVPSIAGVRKATVANYLPTLLWLPVLSTLCGP